MILMVSAGDPMLVQLAQRQSRRNREMFGKPYQMFSRLLPVLAPGEHLFVLAKSAYHERDTPLIGDAEDQLYVDPIELFETVLSFCPKYYVGSVYICTSMSAQPNKALDFVRSFEPRFRSEYLYAGGIYACTAPAALDIPAPADPCWVTAENTSEPLSMYAFLADI